MTQFVKSCECVRLTQVGDRVEKGHVGAPYGRVTDLGIEGHLTREHAVQSHLERERLQMIPSNTFMF